MNAKGGIESGSPKVAHRCVAPGFDGSRRLRKTSRIIHIDRIATIMNQGSSDRRHPWWSGRHDEKGGVVGGEKGRIAPENLGDVGMPFEFAFQETPDNAPVPALRVAKRPVE